VKSEAIGFALRFLFDLPRYSEDLDFSLESPEGYETATRRSHGNTARKQAYAVRAAPS
jgi:Nucleotidyl transferase AbiEii toxin, Type IV TA system